MTEDLDMTDDAFDRAAAHLAAASRLFDDLRAKGRLGRLRSGPSVSFSALVELTAASENLHAALVQMREQGEIHDQALARLEVVTAGDERLMDDLAAAIEELQREVDELRTRQDLLVERPPDSAAR